MSRPINYTSIKNNKSLTQSLQNNSINQLSNSSIPYTKNENNSVINPNKALYSGNVNNQFQQEAIENSFPNLQNQMLISNSMNRNININSNDSLRTSNYIINNQGNFNQRAGINNLAYNQKISDKLHTTSINNTNNEIQQNQSQNQLNNNIYSNNTGFNASVSRNNKDNNEINYYPKSEIVNRTNNNNLVNSQMNQNFNLKQNSNIYNYNNNNNNPNNKTINYLEKKNPIGNTQIPSPLNNNLYKPTDNIYVDNSNNWNNNNINKNNIMINQEVIKCDNHIKMNENIQANRYCSTCRVFLCDACVISYHDTHVKYCKESIDKILMDKQDEILSLNDEINILSKNKSCDQQKIILNDMNARISEQERETKKRINEIRKYLDDIEKGEINICRKLINDATNFTNNEINNVSDSAEKEFIENKNKIIKIKQDWYNYSKTRKAEFIKEDKLGELRRSLETNKYKLKENEITINRYLNKVSNSLKETLSNFSNITKLDNLISSFKDLIQRINQNTKQNFELKDLPFQQEESDEDQSVSNKYSIFRHNQNINNNLNNQQDYSQFFDFNTLNYEYLISIKDKKQIIYYNLDKKEINRVNLNEAKFLPGTEPFESFYDNSKSVNLCSNLIVTGGIEIIDETRIDSSKCFEIKIINNQATVSIFKSMLQGRQGHNIIYLYEREIIVTCGGFLTNKTEIFEMKNNWKIGPEMSKSRANASLAYVNKRYVCCFGGYESSKGSQNGRYLNSCEILDLDLLKNGWRSFDLPINFNLCATGIISKSSNKILLCGGYDGKLYFSENYECEINKKNDGSFNIKLKEYNSKLPLPTIFLENNFCRNDKCTYAFDIYFNLIIYDIRNGSFKYTNLNA